MRKLALKIVNLLKRHRQIIYFLICLAVSFFLWLFITYGKDYEYSVSYIVKFADKNNVSDFYTTDSVITLTFKSNGFDFLAHTGPKSVRKIMIDVDKLNLNLSNGQTNVPISRLKPQITELVNYGITPTSISPSSIHLKWKKLYRKTVDIVSDNEYAFLPPFDMYADEELLTKQAVIEGDKALLEQINTIHTKKLQYKNINKTTLFLSPLMLDSLPDGVRCQMTCVPIKVTAEEFTEDVAYLNIKVIGNEDFRNIYVFPQKVKVRYRIAMKDYRKFKAQDMNAYVIFEKENIDKQHRLKIQLSNVPDFVKIVNTYPESTEYLAFQ